MKAVKIGAIVLGLYVAIVVAFESLIGIVQPTTGDTLVITTTDDEDESHDRVLARLESQGHLYVAANHWPRSWYRDALEHPEVEITIDGERDAYRAVPVSEAEHERVHREHEPGLVFRFLTGFAPREILRLEPIEGGDTDASSDA